jgi:hypothetical protein
MKYFQETGRLLDIKSNTICTGSAHDDPPRVHSTSDGKVIIDVWNPSDSGQRPRLVIS